MQSRWLFVVLLVAAGRARHAAAQDKIWSWDGSQSAQLGWSVRAAGDLDGDGRDDVIVGAPNDQTAGLGRGAAYVYSGATGLVLRSCYGSNDDDNLGWAVDGAGDVDGDGTPDFIAGSENGYARVYSGVDASQLYEFSANPNIHFGASVSGVGDVDADGYADVAVGAWADDTVATDCGSAWIYSGRDGSLLYKFSGANANEWLGYAISPAGDPDLDGFADMFFGAPGQTNASYAVAYSGQTGNELFRFSDVANTGFSVAHAGDWNGDGVDDVAVGNPGVSGPYSDSGKASVLSGKDGTSLIDFIGQDDLAFFGCAIGGGRDVNGDGVPDLVVGAYNDYRGGIDRTGSAQLFSGSSGRLLYAFYGENDGEWFGQSLDLVGDMDGDGLADLAVGAYLASDVNPHGGRADTYAGNDLFLEPDFPDVPEGVQLVLNVRGGGATSPYALFLADVDGVPFMIPLRVGKLDAFGEARFVARVPRGFGTHDLDFVAFACDNPAIHRGVAESSIATIHTTP